MALSNIRKEPRREITESAIGIVLVVGAIWLDYWLARRCAPFMAADMPWQAAMFIIPIIVVSAAMLFMMLLHGTHALGEAICGALARRGLELRPKNRPGQIRVPTTYYVVDPISGHMVLKQL